MARANLKGGVIVTKDRAPSRILIEECPLYPKELCTKNYKIKYHYFQAKEKIVVWCCALPKTVCLSCAYVCHVQATAAHGKGQAHSKGRFCRVPLSKMHGKLQAHIILASLT